MSKEICVDTSNIDSKYWEKILASEGMPSKLPEISDDSLEVAQETEHKIKQEHDDAIIFENNFNSAYPLNKFGLPPCKQGEMQVERSSANIDTDFKSE